ncbi:MAG: hypothetical protein JSR85_01155 [Proteobacteria bacterium]|nr:hypothetical protein [Pseudomonadota bacterium]
MEQVTVSIKDALSDFMVDYEDKRWTNLRYLIGSYKGKLSDTDNGKTVTLPITQDQLDRHPSEGGLTDRDWENVDAVVLGYISRGKAYKEISRILRLLDLDEKLYRFKSKEEKKAIKIDLSEKLENALKRRQIYSVPEVKSLTEEKEKRAAETQAKIDEVSRQLAAETAKAAAAQARVVEITMQFATEAEKGKAVQANATAAQERTEELTKQLALETEKGKATEAKVDALTKQLAVETEKSLAAHTRAEELTKQLALEAEKGKVTEGKIALLTKQLADETEKGSSARAIIDSFGSHIETGLLLFKAGWEKYKVSSSAP